MINEQQPTIEQTHATEVPPPALVRPAPSDGPLARAAICVACGVGLVPGVNVCTACGQVLALPRGVRLASPGRRLGGYLLDFVLVGLTLGLGALIWSMIVWCQGQTPAKQLLGMRVIDAASGEVVGWGRMFLRNVVFEVLVLALLSLITFGIGSIVGSIWLLWDQRRQNLYDKMASTLVVYWPAHIAYVTPQRALILGP